MVRLMHKAKSKLYLSEYNFKKSLFAICNKLLGLEKSAPFPNTYLMYHLPAICNDFFINKVKLIITSIDHRKLQSWNSTTIVQTSLTIMTPFIQLQSHNFMI